MKLSHVVAQHGYQPSELAEIEKARLYEPVSYTHLTLPTISSV